MSFVKDFARFFHTRSDSNTAEINAYLFGLMQAKRGAKNLERMEEHVPDFNDQAVHDTISHSPWDYRPLMDEVARRASGLLGGAPRCRLVIDDSGFGKKGDGSVGVARMHNGRLGKIENSLIAVCTSLASGQQSTPIDIRLYLPEVWCGDPQRCEKAGIPEDQRRFLTKPGIALQSIRHQRQLDIGFDCVSMDSGYGSGQAFPYSLDRDGETFAAEVHCNQRVWVEAPWPHRQGARPSQTLLHTKVAHPQSHFICFDGSCVICVGLADFTNPVGWAGVPAGVLVSGDRLVHGFPAKLECDEEGLGVVVMWGGGSKFSA